MIRIWRQGFCDFIFGGSLHYTVALSFLSVAAWRNQVKCNGMGGSCVSQGAGWDACPVELTKPLCIFTRMGCSRAFSMKGSSYCCLDDDVCLTGSLVDWWCFFLIWVKNCLIPSRTGICPIDFNKQLMVNTRSSQWLLKIIWDNDSTGQEQKASQCHFLSSTWNLPFNLGRGTSLGRVSQIGGKFDSWQDRFNTLKAVYVSWTDLLKSFLMCAFREFWTRYSRWFNVAFSPGKRGKTIYTVWHQIFQMPCSPAAHTIQTQISSDPFVLV